MDFEPIKAAAREALKNATAAAGQDNDPDIQTYKMLKPAHFPKLIEKYGLEPTLAYIHEMENRLAGGKKNAR